MTAVRLNLLLVYFPNLYVRLFKVLVEPDITCKFPTKSIFIAWLPPRFVLVLDRQRRSTELRTSFFKAVFSVRKIEFQCHDLHAARNGPFKFRNGNVISVWATR